MLYTMDLTILNLAIPVISRELMPTRPELEAPGLWLARIDL